MLALHIIMIFSTLSGFCYDKSTELTGRFFSRIENENIISGGDFITNSKIYTSPANVRGIAAAIEQRGSTAGKVWSIVLYSTNDNFPDTFKVYYSLTGGQTWQYYTGGNIRPGDKVNYNDIDMELIENTGGQKYLWVTFGFRQGGASGPLKTGGFILQAPGINGVFFNEISWPGVDSTKNYYDIHITSDNARYAPDPYVYLVCSFDSLDGSGSRIYGQKFARNLTPYSLGTVSFSYMSRPFYWSDSSPVSYRKTVYSDIAYFNNGGSDSLIVSFSGAKDSTKLYFAKCDRNGTQPGAQNSAGESIGGTEPGDLKTHARLSSNGNGNGSVICTFRQQTGGNWSVKYFASESFGDFSAPFSQSQLLGSNTNQNYSPDIIGVRNGSSHYLSFITSASPDSLHFMKISGGLTTDHVSKMNYYPQLDQRVGPRALFSYNYNDSCLVFYTEAGPNNLVAASGCGGEPIGILNNSIPLEYKLYQNYPNPFNPATSISYSIPVRGMVKLTVYDVLGKEISSLVSSYRNPGTYSISFDAGDLSSGVYFYRLTVNEEGGGTTALFSEVKKMAIVK